ncbi:hypothetical protein KKH30_00035 [Candidatus Micrarchaeota archaeon]|nr:hypothetical protein [Candidatus Micrarchaeota archaeon]
MGIAKKILVLLFLLILAGIPANAYIDYLTVQGKLTDSAGASYLSGTYDMVFKIYDSPTGATAIYTESHTGANAVTVRNGFYSAELGSITSLDLNYMQNYWLGITVGSDSEMSPRQPFIPQPYAMSGKIALDVNCSNCATDSEIDNNISLITSNDVNLSGKINVYDLNAGNTISVGGAMPGALGDMNISEYVHLSGGSKIMQARDSGALDSPMHFWVSAPESMNNTAGALGVQVFETSVEVTADANVSFAFPIPQGMFGSTAVLDAIILKYNGVNGTNYLDDIYIEEINMGAARRTSPVVTYTTNITSGTSKTLTSSDTSDLPYALVSSKPYMITVYVQSDASPVPVNIYGFRLDYHLE